VGAGAVTVDGVTLTSKADKDRFEVEFQANRLNGICKFRFKDDSGVVGGSAISIREQSEILITDDGTRVYGGRVAVLTPTFEGNTVYYTGSAISFDCLLDERIIESGVRSGSRYDDDDFKWILGFHSELLSSLYVSRLRTAVLPTIDYSGMTLRKAVETLASHTTGAAYWIDENKQGHWTDPLTAQRVKNPAWDGGVSTNWTLDAAAAVTADSGPGGTGDYALITTGSGAGMKESTQEVTAITGGARHLFVADLWSSVASKAQVRLDWQNNASVSQRVDTITNSGATSTWARFRQILTAPSLATKVVVRLGGVNNFTGTVRHDNLALIGEDAAFGIDSSPNGTTTVAPIGWAEDRKATVPVNRVLVRGTNISGWREQAASIAYYGKKFEGIVNDDRVTTSDGIDSRAQAVFRKYAFPARSITYGTTKSGLLAGKWQILNLTVGAYSLSTIEFISTLRIRWLGNGKMFYEVTTGEAEEDVASSMVAAQAAYTATGTTLGQPIYAVADVTAPAVPTGLTLTSDTGLDANGATIVRIIATLTHPADVDYFGSYIEITRDNDGDQQNPSPVWTQPMKLLLGKEATKVAFEGVAGNAKYWGRAYSVDTSGNKSVFTSVVSVSTAKDGVAPGQPQAFTAVAGNRGVALRWATSGAQDLMFYQVRYGTNGTVWPDLVNTRDTVLWVPALTPDTLYYFQVRAVDFSGNTVTSGADPTPVNYLANPDAGYTSSVTATPGVIGMSPDDIAAYSITSAMISTAGLSADVIKSGKVTISPTGATAMEIRDSAGALLAQWTPTGGITIYGTTQADYAVLDDAYLRFYKGGALTAEMSPDGIVADSIRLGALPGGHNVILNSSFEMAAFVTGTSSVTFTDNTGTPGWKAGNRTTSPDNVTEGSTLTPTTAAY
jgi:hypothetical protein